MSTTAYYNFIGKRAPSSDNHQHAGVDGRRQSTNSPSSYITTSSSTSNSSLNQLNSLTTNFNNSPNQQQSNTSPDPSSSSASSSSDASIVNSHHQARTRHSSLIGQMSINLLAQQHHQMTRSRSPTSKLLHSYTLHSLDPKPYRPFKTNSEYLEAMKEDLAEWLNRLYPDLELNVENFFASLETGAIICRHANNVTQMGRSHIQQQQQHQQETSISSSDSGLNDEITTNTIDSNKNSPTSPTLSNSSLCNYRKSSTATDATKIRQKRFSMITGSDKIINNSSINWFNIKMIPFKQDAKAGTFFARDNICQFILWCRSLNIIDCLLFETDDLVARKNEKSFILCLLEVARIGFKVGMPTPLIIQFEQEIDQEIENDAKLEEQEAERRAKVSEINGFDDQYSLCNATEEENSLIINNEETTDLKDDQSSDERSDLNSQSVHEEENNEVEDEDLGPKPQVITNDLVSLHEKVVQLLCQCTCPTQFPMVRVGDKGKYKVGDKLIIFVRILRRHIMVRVGGGWQELSEFLRVKDPCRSASKHHHFHSGQSPGNSHHNATHFQAKPYQNNNNGSFTTRFGSNNNQGLASLTASLTKCRLVESSNHLNTKAHQQQYLFKNSYATHNGTGSNSNSSITSHGLAMNSGNEGRQRLISGSASMSWLSQPNP